MTVVSQTSTAVAQPANRHAFERRLFGAAAILFPLIILIGFAPTYYLRGAFSTQPLPSLLVHLHGLLMTAWVGLFVTQVYFISSRRVRVHQRLGRWAIGLAAGIVVIGLVTAVRAAKYGSPSMPPNVAPLQFVAVPLFDLVMFVLLFGAAIFYRRKPQAHKALILLTAINFLPPAVARINIPTLQSLGPLWFFGFPGAVALVCLGLETWHHRRLNRVFLAGTLALIASYFVRLALMPTTAWVSFATWLTSFV
jgi:hypothetical protein